MWVGCRVQTSTYYRWEAGSAQVGKWGNARPRDKGQKDLTQRKEGTGRAAAQETKGRRK